MDIECEYKWPNNLIIRQTKTISVPKYERKDGSSAAGEGEDIQAKV